MSFKEKVFPFQVLRLPWNCLTEGEEEMEKRGGGGKNCRLT